MDIKTLLKEISNGESALGGGAIAPVSGAIGVALGHRVLVSLSSSKQEEFADTIADLKAELLDYQQAFLQAVEDDKDATDHLLETFALPKSNEAEKESRTDALQKALIVATETPLKTMALTVEVMETFAAFAAMTTQSTAADFEIAMYHLETVLMSANVNVEENVDLIKDEELANKYDQQAKELVEAAESVFASIEE